MALGSSWFVCSGLKSGSLFAQDEPEGGNESALLDDPEFDNASTSELQSLASKMPLGPLLAKPC